MEGACAYFEATGKDKFLSVMLKNALHIYDVFVTKNHQGIPGHPEVKLAFKIFGVFYLGACIIMAVMSVIIVTHNTHDIVY